MPCWLCAALCFEAVLVLGVDAQAWSLTAIGRNVTLLPGLAGSVGMLTALGGTLYHVASAALTVFAVALDVPPCTE